MRPMFLVAATAVITACGGGGSYGSMNGPAYGGGSGTPSGGGAGSPYGGGGTVSSAGTDAGSTSPVYVITISNLSFSPLNLAVPPGTTVAVINRDGMPHSVTSEARSGAYTRGAPAGLAPFDTGEFSSGQRTITIPANAPGGTVIPYYCVVHTTTMQTPNGTITVASSAAPASTSTPTGAPMPPTGTSTPGGTTGSGTGGMGTGTGTGTNTGGGSGGMGGYGSGG